ncbi:MAG: HU family DNA-binding protein [Eubacterium ventriosum]
MNKTEFIAAIAEEAGLSKTDAAKAVKAFTDVVVEEMKKGEKIQLVGFRNIRSFKETYEQSRESILQQKEKITITMTINVPKFKAGAETLKNCSLINK